MNRVYSICWLLSGPLVILGAINLIFGIIGPSLANVLVGVGLLMQATVLICSPLVGQWLADQPVNSSRRSAA